MIEREILQALQKATIQAVNGSIIPDFPLKFIGRTFVVPDNGRYLELVMIPNNEPNQYWGKEKRYRGLFRLLLHWGLDDAGAYEPLDFVSSFCQGFSKGSRFQNGAVSVKVTDEPDLTGVIEQAPEMIFPVTVRYESFKI